MTYWDIVSAKFFFNGCERVRRTLTPLCDLTMKLEHGFVLLNAGFRTTLVLPILNRQLLVIMINYNAGIVYLNVGVL